MPDSPAPAPPTALPATLPALPGAALPAAEMQKQMDLLLQKARAMTKPSIFVESYFRFVFLFEKKKHVDDLWLFLAY